MATSEKATRSLKAGEISSGIPLLFESNAPDWRIWFGIIVSSVWLGVLALYVSVSIGWRHIGEAPIETVGNFLEGAFAPLAFLWLVIGYFLQKKELSQNTEAIRMQHAEIQKSAEQAVIQSDAIRATELHTRRESFLKIAENVKHQLGSILGMLVVSSQGMTASGAMGNKNLSQLWSSLSQNDPEVFARTLMELHAIHGDHYAYKLFYGTAIRTKHTTTFIEQFERLLTAARTMDDDGMITDAFMGTAHGLVYKRALAFRSEPPDGFVYGVYDFDPDTTDS